MGSDQGVLFAGASDESFEFLEPRRAHVRSKVVFRKGLDPSLRVFDYELQVPPDHEVRWLKSSLKSLDLRFLEDLYEDKGGVGYRPEHLLGAICYGLKLGIRSGSGLEEACRYDNRFRVLTDGLSPSYKTFERALVRFAPVLPEVLSRIFGLAKSERLVSGLEVAVDGAKVGGASSEWNCRAGLPSSDPDARKMDSHGRKCLGYNVQVAVDTLGEGGLILGAEVIQDQNDLHAMPEVLAAMRQQFGDLPVQVLADTGYESASTIQHLEDQGIESCIAPSEEPHPSLRLNAEGDIVCPVGKRLLYLRTKENDGRSLDHYRPEGGCRGCPLSKTCAFYGKRLMVAHKADPAARFRNRQRALCSEGAMVRRRLAERPFVLLRTQLKRFLRRGLTKVRAEFLLWVASYNLFAIWTTLKRRNGPPCLFWAWLIAVICNRARTLQPRYLTNTTST